MTENMKSRLFRQLTAVFRERGSVAKLTLKVTFHEVNSSLSTNVSVNLDYYINYLLSAPCCCREERTHIIYTWYQVLSKELE